MASTASASGGAGGGAGAGGAAAAQVVVDDAGCLAVTKTATKPFDDQKPGTSGLRKKTKKFTEDESYLRNFVASIFLALDAKEYTGKTLVVSGDGRYYNSEAIQIICQMAAAYGVARVWIGQDGLLSTPAVSAIIREREGGCACGGIILTASHNPGGPDDDFGIKYNTGNGGPAQEDVTGAIFEQSKVIASYSICSGLPKVDLSKIGSTLFKDATTGTSFEVEVISNTEDLLAMYAKVFDLDAIKAYASRKNFSLLFDGLSGVAGPYAKAVVLDVLGLPASSLVNCDPKPDFGGGHPDPNLVYAKSLVAAMGLKSDGSKNSDKAASEVPDFGAAADGDADRNMILGRQFFVTPSDSVAIIAANSAAIPFFKGGLKGVARSMPTSCALDRVAEKLGIRHFVVPTGWKFFGSLMDSTGKDMVFTPFLCGEESFGTGSNHIREKDGLWAVLAWLSILAAANKDVPTDGSTPLKSVEDVVRDHWSTYGRNYYSRYDYEAVDAGKANEMMDHLRAVVAAFEAGTGQSTFGELTMDKCNEFNYTDPVNGSVTTKQGMRFYFKDGSRVVFRLSGTGSVGATIRMYLERHEADPSKHDLATADALQPVVAAALQLSRVVEFTGREEPSVIT